MLNQLVIEETFDRHAGRQQHPAARAQIAYFITGTCHSLAARVLEQRKISLATTVRRSNFALKNLKMRVPCALMHEKNQQSGSCRDASWLSGSLAGTDGGDRGSNRTGCSGHSDWQEERKTTVFLG